MFIFNFFYFFTHSLNTLLTVLMTPLDSICELTGGDGPDDPFPGLLVVDLVQEEDGHGLLHLSKKIRNLSEQDLVIRAEAGTVG